MSLLHHTTHTGAHSTVFASSPRRKTTFRPAWCGRQVVGGESLLRTSSSSSPQPLELVETHDTSYIRCSVFAAQRSHQRWNDFCKFVRSGTDDTDVWPDAHVWVVFDMRSVTWEAANAQH